MKSIPSSICRNGFKTVYWCWRSCRRKLSVHFSGKKIHKRMNLLHFTAVLSSSSPARTFNLLQVLMSKNDLPSNLGYCSPKFLYDLVFNNFVKILSQFFNICSVFVQLKMVCTKLVRLPRNSATLFPELSGHTKHPMCSWLSLPLFLVEWASPGSFIQSIA